MLICLNGKIIEGKITADSVGLTGWFKALQNTLHLVFSHNCGHYWLTGLTL